MFLGLLLVAIGLGCLASYLVVSMCLTLGGLWLLLACTYIQKKHKYYGCCCKHPQLTICILHKYKHTYMYARTHACRHAYVHAYMHTHACSCAGSPSLPVPLSRARRRAWTPTTRWSDEDPPNAPPRAALPCTRSSGSSSSSNSRAKWKYEVVGIRRYSNRQ